jgi:hypothetical protein
MRKEKDPELDAKFVNNVLGVSYKKKIGKNNFLASLKSLKKGVGSISQKYGSGDPDRIRTKMSRIPNTGVLRVLILIPYTVCFLNCRHFNILISV